VEIKDDTLQIFGYLVTRGLLDIDIWPSLSTLPTLTHFFWSPLITAALVANALAIHPALSSATPSFFVPSFNPPPFQGCPRFTSGEEIASINARNSKYSPTLATKSSLRLSPSGRPSSGASCWGRAREVFARERRWPMSRGCGWRARLCGVVQGTAAVRTLGGSNFSLFIPCFDICRTSRCAEVNRDLTRFFA